MRCPDCGFKLNGGVCFQCGGNLPISNERQLTNFDSFAFRQFTAKQEIDKALHSLEGLFKGITIDNKVNQTEIEELTHWYYTYKNMADLHPYSEVIPTVYHALKDNQLDSEEIADILWLCQKFKTDNMFYDMITADIQRLQGILHGILSDNEIGAEEIKGLKEWLADNEHMCSTYPYDEIYSLAVSVLSDGILSEEEKKFIKAFFSQFVDIAHSLTIDASEIKRLKQEVCVSGICAMTPEIAIQNKVYCFTGVSSKTSRKGFAELITTNGGRYIDNVSGKVDYLVIGNEGNPCWAFSCYGRKVELALGLRREGHRIMIVHEHDFWDAFQDIAQ